MLDAKRHWSSITILLVLGRRTQSAIGWPLEERFASPGNRNFRKEQNASPQAHESQIQKPCTSVGINDRRVSNKDSDW
jgi:hypothetical protein